MPYEVVEPITHLGRAYAKGAPIALRPHEAYQLLAAGCVKEVPPPVPVERPAVPRGEVRRESARPSATPVPGVFIAPLVKPLAKD